MMTTSEQSSSRSRHNVLLVDDHDGERLAIRTTLEVLGHTLVEARSGDEALERVQELDFAVILLDVQMPGLGGPEIARRIRRQRFAEHTPIIFLSADEASDFPPAAAYSAGAMDYLVKPVVPEVLRAKVAALVELRLLADNARRQADQLRLLVDGTREYAIFLLDPSGRVETWNSGAERIKGYAAAEILGRHFSCFYVPEDQAAGKPQRVLDSAARAGTYEEEGWRVRQDNSRFWASVVVTALRDEQGTLRGFSKVTRDLTERVQAEVSARRLLEEETARRAAEASAREAQRAHEEEYRQREQWRVTLSSIGDAVIVTDTQGAVTFLNPVAEALTGWDQTAATGEPLETVFRIINEETRLPVESPVVKVLREGFTIGLANHTILMARDGREYLIDDAAAPIRTEDGSITGVVLVFRDVTEARRAIEVRLHLAAIVESSDDAIISKNLDGIITSWNRGAERLFGYSAGEIVGRPLSLLVPPDHPDELPMLLERLKRGERIEHFETVRLRKDGRPVEVSLTISPVRNADGRIIGASKIARDITSLKEAERRKDEFLAILGHELRNPLATIVNGMEMLRRMQHGAGERLCEIIDRQARHMRQLVDDLLDVSRITRGLITLKLEPLDLLELLKRVAEDHQRMFEERGCQLRLALPADPLWIEGSATRLVQVFGNLLHNAWKFTASGDDVTLTAESSREGGVASVTVRDTGAGMTPDTMARLFEPFSQSGRALNQDYGGLGLGLTLVKGLCALHGGSVDAYSGGPGQGSVFTVRLPLASESAAVAAAPPGSTGPSAGRSFRVLVVEDSQPVAEVFAMMLRELGHEVGVVASGAEALSHLAADRPEIVFSDISMPGMSGYELAEHIRRIPDGERAFLVAMTGFGQPEDRRRALDSGFDEHLVKPLELDSLQSVFTAADRNPR